MQHPEAGNAHRILVGKGCIVQSPPFSLSVKEVRMRKSEQVRVRVTPNDALQLDTLAEVLGQSRSGTMRFLIRHAELVPPRLHLLPSSSSTAQDDSSRREKDGREELGVE